MTKEEIYALLKQKYDFVAPDWWECQWRRIPCRRPECALCGRIMKQRFKHQFKGEDPDTMEAPLQDVGDAFAETKTMLTEKAEELGIELDPLPEEEYESPPEPDRFPIWQKVFVWSQNLQHLAIRQGMDWRETEAGQDLHWYSSMITAKLYRILCDRWRLEQGQKDDNLDYDYTKYVLENCVRIIKESFENLIVGPWPKTHELTDLHDQFLEMEQVLLSA